MPKSRRKINYSRKKNNNNEMALLVFFLLDINHTCWCPTVEQLAVSSTLITHLLFHTKMIFATYGIKLATSSQVKFQTTVLTICDKVEHNSVTSAM